jgi:5-methylcytosine-specific restriction endonuclease McrA
LGWKKEEVQKGTLYNRQWLETEAGQKYKERTKELRKEYRQKNKEAIRLGKKRSEEATRLECLQHYSDLDLPACQCGEDNMNRLRIRTLRDSAQTRCRSKEGMGDPDEYYRLKKAGWPEGFHVVCFECNKANAKKRVCKSGPENAKYKREQVECATCNKALMRQQVHLRNNKTGAFFCSDGCHGQWLAKYNVGENCHNFKEHALTLSCAQCGKEVKRKRCNLSKSKRVFCSKPCEGDWKSANIVGDKVYNFAGGYDGYYGTTWPSARRATRKRDRYLCQRCGKTQKDNGKALDVHHKLPFRYFGIERHIEANDLTNLILFCATCHKWVESNETPEYVRSLGLQYPLQTLNNIAVISDPE